MGTLLDFVKGIPVSSMSSFMFVWVTTPPNVDSWCNVITPHVMITTFCLYTHNGNSRQLSRYRDDNTLPHSTFSRRNTPTPTSVVYNIIVFNFFAYVLDIKYFRIPFSM